MAIGAFVKSVIPSIIQYCENVDPEEFNRLCDADYSKENFGLSSWRFFIRVGDLDDDNLETDSGRYWKNTFIVCGQSVRACSQWYEKMRGRFLNYLHEKNITVNDAEAVLATDGVEQEVVQERETDDSVANTTVTNRRYRGNHIGNAQNLAIRNILSNLGSESFSAQDWNETCQFFENRCAYCGAETNLEMDHAIPINKDSLGEHRLGNLIPSCHACNANKHGQDYRTFLGNDTARINRIENYMRSRHYNPLGNNEKICNVLEMAHEDFAAVANRYISLINKLFIEQDEEN